MQEIQSAYPIEAQIYGSAMSSITPDLQRKIFRGFQSSVVVMTAEHRGLDVGITLSSLVSVSLDPPLASVSIAKRSSRTPIFLDAKEVAIHILASDEAQLADMFARSGSQPFVDLLFERSEEGAPLLPTRGSILLGRPWSKISAGDHWIYLVEILGGMASSRCSLTYLNGRYVNPGYPLKPCRL